MNKWICFLFVCVAQGFFVPLPKYRNLRIYEPPHSVPQETNCVLFFTGGSNAISSSIYCDFFESMNKQNITVYVPSFQHNHIACLIRILHNKYKKVIMMGHSSGCTTLLNHCNHPQINDVVLMDPVNTKLWGEKHFTIPFVRTLLFLHAEKSYKVNHDPYGWPFIPFLRITKDQLKGPNLSKVAEITASNYGHSDVLNPFYSNLMHFTRITVGNKNRTTEKLHGYHDQLSDTVLHFMEDEKTRCPTCPPQTIYPE